MKKINKFCCKKMEAFLSEHNSPLSYEPYTRSYSLEYSYVKNNDPNQVVVAELIYYCPWCGKKLPKELMDEWAEIVNEKFGLDDTLDRKQIEELPQELKTDEWWKKREL